MTATNSAPLGAASEPVISVDTANPSQAKPPSPGVGVAAMTPGSAPLPAGTNPVAEQGATRGDSADPQTGIGVDGELTIWEARYSNRNFIGRIGFRVFLTLAWFGMAYYTWGDGHETWAMTTWVALAVVGLLWAGLVFRMIQAHYSHYYRLTNRRLFVSTGVIHRRRDMMELLRVKDIFTRQLSLTERWLGLGTVVVVPTEKELPTFYLAGVNQPKDVMDLIWHHARAERDERSVKVDSV